MSVFISYTSSDRATARRVAELFRSRGTEVWMDEGEIAPGDSLASALAAGMHRIDACVVVMTKASVESRWVKREADMAVSRMVDEGIEVMPLRFDGCEIPTVFAGLVWGDCRTEEGLIRAINRCRAKLGFSIPMTADEIRDRYRDRVPVDYGVRLIPSQDAASSERLGPPEREYVMIGDYAEQAGRSLRQILTNLWFGDAFDEISSSNLEWTALVFEIGESHSRKLDVLPGTWKAVFRILSSRNRLALVDPTSEEKEALGPVPRDYTDGDQSYWYGRITQRRESGVPDSLLHDKFGIRWLCFRGEGITYSRGTRSPVIPSRVFLVRNVPLEALSVRKQNLGHPDDGVLLA